MPGIPLHLGQSQLDFSSGVASHSPVPYGVDMYYQQHIVEKPSTMEQIYPAGHVLHEESGASPTKSPKKNLMQTLWDTISIGAPSFWSKMNNPLSVTVVKDDMVPSEIYGNSSAVRKRRALELEVAKSYLYTQEKSLDAKISRYEQMQEILRAMPSLTAIINHMNLLHDPRSDDAKMQREDSEGDLCTAERAAVEYLIRNTMDSAVKREDIMESHFASYETKNKPSNATDNSSPMETDLQTCTAGDEDACKNSTVGNINEDTTDAESFLMVSHCDAPPELASPVRVMTPLSMRFSNMCRKAWRGMTERIYCRTDSMDSEIPVKRPKQHHRRRANDIARSGGGRGRARCQLRRSGVSQTRHRQERTKHIQDDYESWRETMQNDRVLDDADGQDVIDAAQFMKKTTSPIIFNLSDITPTKQKLKARKKHEDAKRPTRVRYVPSPKINEGEDYDMTQRRPRLFSESSNDSEDFVVFEDSGDELLMAHEQPKHSNGICYVPDSWNSHRIDSAWRGKDGQRLSESSIDSEDSFCIVFKSELNATISSMTDDEDNCSLISFRNGDSPLSKTNEDDLYSETQEDEDSDDLTAQEDEDSNGLMAQTKKVNFNSKPVVHLMVKWDYAYRAARKGPWEQMARDNDRFKARINCIAAVLNPILTNEHRSQIWQKRFALLD